jgi:hypothetical protein
MTLAAGLAVIAALIVLTGAEIRAARLGLERPNRKELIVLGAVFFLGTAAAVVRLLFALRVL